MVPFRWPVIANIRYESPPRCRSYGPDEDEDLEPEQRAAKRRRIEHNTQEYLKGKELYISSAVLKGTFASNCANPWRNESGNIHVPNSDDGEEEILEEDFGGTRLAHLERDHEGAHAQTLKRRVAKHQTPKRPELATWDNTRMERPTSRASAGYCTEWLQRQNLRVQTPTIDSDDDIDIDIDRPRRRAPLTTSKSPTQHVLSRKVAQNSGPVKARYARSSRRDRSSPIRPQSSCIELHRRRVATFKHEQSIVGRLPESMDVTAGSITLQHPASPGDKRNRNGEQNYVNMPPPRFTGFTAINSSFRDGGTRVSDSARRVGESGLPMNNASKGRHEILRNSDKITGRTVFLDAKGPLAAVHNSRHPYVASPAVANGSPGFPYRRVSDGNKALISAPISNESAVRTISHSRTHATRGKGDSFAFSGIGEIRSERTRDQHVGTEDSLFDHDHRRGHSEITHGAALENRTMQKSKSMIELDPLPGDREPAYEGSVHEDPVDNMRFDDPGSAVPKESPVNHVPSKSSSENKNRDEVRIVEPSAEDIRLNGIMAKWRCPVATCLREFNTRGGLASHITRGHKLQVANDKTLGNPKPKGPGKAVKSAGRAHKRRIDQENDIDVTGSIYNPRPKKVPKTKQPAHRSAIPRPPEPSPAPPLPEPSLATQLREPSPAPQLSGHALADSALPSPSLPPQLPELDFGASGASSRANVTPLPEMEFLASPEGRIESKVDNADANADDLIHDDDDNIDINVVDEDNIPQPPLVLGQQDEDSGEKTAKHIASPKERTSTVVSGTTIPDHQNSGAYSTFTYNPEQSTQAALFQAQLAFQETQAGDQYSDAGEYNSITPFRETGSSAAVFKSVYSLGAVTPFRELNNRFSAPAAPTPVFPVLPAATQDLEAAAAGVMFSTVKKPRAKKRISFENWPTTKPSKDSVTKILRKSVEWSPFTSEKPAAKDFYVASISTMNRSDKIDGSRSESLPRAHEDEGISVLEAASSSLLMKPPKANSFAAATPRSHVESLSADTDSFSSKPLAMSSALSSDRRGSQNPSVLSEVPVPSFQEGQGGMLAELNSQDVDEILDDSNHFLGSWDPEQVNKSSFLAASSLA
ncbi:hypothetical protein FKW77_008871 [Venturia effusa]|uniref:C2H2-type domain-containing protein n=1 Tax=Venturia effusa TaxID=50376 RepID=A0A517LG52_9PEZI|nr:hypothetical protein FKW77_008871 [Venturia effusa]